jgi:uncharacterized protein with PIN domain
MRAPAIAFVLLATLLTALGGARAESRGVPCATIEACDAVIRTDPGLAAYERRGYLHLMRSDIDNAIADFSAAIAIDASRAFSLYGRGMARLISGDAAGQNEMEAAIMLRPDIDAEFKRSAAE